MCSKGRDSSVGIFLTESVFRAAGLSYAGRSCSIRLRLYASTSVRIKIKIKSRGRFRESNIATIAIQCTLLQQVYKEERADIFVSLNCFREAQSEIDASHSQWRVAYVFGRMAGVTVMHVFTHLQEMKHARKISFGSILLSSFILA